MPHVEEVPSDAGSDEQQVTVKSASHMLILESRDKAFTDLQGDTMRQLEAFSDSGAVQAVKLFNSIMDPAETKRLMEEHFFTPMKAMSDKMLEAVSTIDTADPEDARKKLQVKDMILASAAKHRVEALETVYSALDRQLEQFASSTESYNDGMRKTCQACLEMYKAKVDAEVAARKEILAVKIQEHEAMLDQTFKASVLEAQHADRQLQTKAKQEAQELERQQKQDEREHQRETAAIERANKKALQEIEHAQKKNDAEHAKMMKELEAREKKGKIDQGARDAVVQEYEV